MSENVREKDQSEQARLTAGDPPDGSPASPTLFLGVVAVSVVLACALLFVPMERQILGLVTVALVIGLLLCGLPIAYSMLLPALLGLWKLGGISVIDGTLRQTVFHATASWELSVIPMFVLMGVALWRSNLSAAAYGAANQWVGHLRGGLAVGTNFAGAGLAAASGSSIAISTALGRIAIPEMIRANYKPSLATGVVAMAGTLGQMIPPSLILVIYAGVAQVPIGQQLLAAFIPGILIAVAFAASILIRAGLKPDLAPAADLSAVTWRTRFDSLASVLPIFLIVLIVVGGLYSGIFTPTEAGAYGALAAVVIGGVSVARSNSGSVRAVVAFLKTSLVDTVISTAGIFLLLIAVEVLTKTLVLSRLATSLSELIVDLNLTRVSFLLIVMLLCFVLGMFLDPLAMILLTVPIFAGPLAVMDVDMIWFGVFIVVLAEVAIVTPPVGMLSFIVHRIAQDPEVNRGVPISLVDVFKGVLPFVGVMLIMLIVFIFFPDIVTWLPQNSLD